MSKTKYFLIAIAALVCSVTAFGAVVWSSAFDFDGTPTSQPVEIDVTTPIVYSSALRDNFDQCFAEAITVTATSQNHPVYVADIFYTDYVPWGELTGTEVWNFKDAKYDAFPKNDTYTLQEIIDTDDGGQTILSRSITLAPEPALIVVLALAGALLMRRRIRGVLTILVLAAIGSIDAWAGGTVTSITCQQAWPISRKVIITLSFTVDSKQAINFYGTTDNGVTTFELSERGTVTGAAQAYQSSGSQTIVWEPDSSLDSVKGKIKIGAEIGDPNYLVVDLSGGSTATRYPYRYIPSVPPGGWSDTYKTKKMVLKLVPAGTFTMGSPSGETGHRSSENQHSVTLTKGFYVGVFEITQGQYKAVTGSNPSSRQISGTSNYDKNPVENVSYDMIRGNDDGSYWPEDDSVDSTSFLGKLRGKTYLSFDLPTEAQWEYACRATTTTALNSGKDLEDEFESENLNEIGWNTYNSVTTQPVGQLLPNSWGLYDMHGNVSEWCLDYYQANLGTAAVTDPVGPWSGSYRVNRGGNYIGEACDCRSASRGQSPSNTANAYGGFRIVLVQ
ncbi:formylglycine-generating enzyme family protein [bacterium]|nr:formylglycine-generating enzyme family protein [bacterium]